MPAEPMITVQVAAKIAEAEDIAVFELVASDGGELPAFSAGAHIDIELAPGLVRQYSLSNNPDQRHRYIIGVLKEPASRGGSIAMHALTPGTSLRISAPRNHFALEPAATRSVLLAGGIGITPLLCMAERLSADGADFELHYCTRSAARAGFRQSIAASGYAGRAHFHFDDGDQAQRLDIAAALGAPHPGTHVYVCGPAGFIDFVLKAATAQGFVAANIHREYFTAGTAVFLEGAAFQVKLAASGKVIDIPAERSVLETLRDSGVDMVASCEQGVCGSCIVGVLEGIPDHRDYFLTDEERLKNNRFTPCCSRSRTPLLVLDL